MTKEETGQLNFFATPVATIRKFRDFAHKFKMSKNSKASDSQIGAMLLEVGIEICEKELEENKSRK